VWCEPHRDPEAYLRDLYRVLPYWPRDRYLKLATRARLDPRELALEIGALTVPPPAPQQQPATNGTR
jgi:hypothetical protein